MNRKKIALMDRYGDSFTEGDNFVGYAKGFLDKGHEVLQLDPYTVDFDLGTVRTYGLSKVVGGISAGKGRREKVENFDMVMDLSDVVDLDFATGFASFDVLHINNPLEMFHSADKRTYVSRYSEFIPETIVSSDVNKLEKALFDRFGGAMIVKDPFGSCGRGIERVTSDSDYSSILDRMTVHGCKDIVAQKFITFAYEGSKRVAVVGKVGEDDSYRIIHSYGRKPESGEWKDNLTQGGSVIEVSNLREDEKELCLNVARRSGLYLVGLDIMDDIDKSGKRIPKLIETNSVLALAKGRYPEKLREVVDFITSDLLE